MRAADRAWLALAGGIILYEAFAPEDELLSEGWDRYLSHHRKGIAIAAAVTPFLVAGHLSNVIPQEIDVISQGFRFIHWLFGK